MAGAEPVLTGTRMELVGLPGWSASTSWWAALRERYTSYTAPPLNACPSLYLSVVVLLANIAERRITCEHFSGEFR